MVRRGPQPDTPSGKLRLLMLTGLLRVSRGHELEGLNISQHGEAFRQALPVAKYLLAARHMSNIVSAACRALILSSSDQLLSAT